VDDLSVPVVLRPSLVRCLLLLVGSLAFVALGLWLVDDNPVIGYVHIAFFGLGAVVFLVQLHPKSSFLEVSSTGFRVAALFREHFEPWSDVTSFKTCRIGLHTMVGWNYTQSYSKHGRLRTANIALAGVEAALPDTYGMKAELLAEFLEHNRALASGPGV
jgi:hypothetical protein